LTDGLGLPLGSGDDDGTPGEGAPDEGEGAGDRLGFGVGFAVGLGVAAGRHADTPLPDVRVAVGGGTT
jgi:hypothetical protein